MYTKDNPNSVIEDADFDASVLNDTDGTPEADVAADNVIDIEETLIREQRDNAANRVDDARDSEPWNQNTWNDATVEGPKSHEFDDLMRRGSEIIIGCQFVGRGGSTRPDKWFSTELPVYKWVEGGPVDGKSPEMGFSRHPVAHRKDGPCYIMGGNGDTGKRFASTIISMDFLALDLDASGDIETIKEKVRVSGLTCFLYTSFNHLKTKDDTMRDNVVKHTKCDGDPTEADLQSFLEAKKGFSVYFAAQCNLTGEFTDDMGKQRLTYSTPPQHKMRLIFPFKDRVILRDWGNTERERLDLWSRKIWGMAKTLDVVPDGSCTDPSRLFYRGAHPEGADFEAVIFRGESLAFEDVPEATKQDFKNAPSNPFEQAGANTNRKSSIPEVTVEYEGEIIDVTKLYRRYGKRWDLTSIIDTFGEDIFLKGGAAGDETAHTRCPYHDFHTNEDGAATRACNPSGAMGDDPEDYASWKCLRNYCQSNDHKLVHMLAQSIENDWLDPVFLSDPDFMFDLPDGKEEASFACLTPIEELGETEARAFWRENGTDDDDGVKAETLSQQLTELGVRPTYVREHVEDAKSHVARQLMERDEDKKRNPLDADPHSPDAIGGQDMPVALQPLHDEDLVTASGFLVDAEAENAKVFREHGLNFKDDAAYLKLKNIVSDQIAAATTDRFDYVVMDGEARVAMRYGPGEPVRLWREATLSKLYKNRAVSYTKEDGKIGFVEPDKVFFHNRRRATYMGTCFEPEPVKGQRAFRTRAEYNLWTGFAVEGVEGDWSKLREHIKENICENDEKIFNWVMTWLASLFARPGVKIPSAIAVRGRQGTGKSKVFDWIRKAIGCGALKVSSGRHLTGNFNAHLDGKIFLTCEEAFWAGDKSAGGVMKDLISSDTLQIESKHVNLIERPNYVNLAFVSNDEWMVPVDKEDARRFLVLTCSEAKIQDAKYFGAIDDQMENGGIEAMVHELTNWNPADVDLTWDSLRAPPATIYLREQAGMGLAGSAARLMDIIVSGELSGRMPDGDVFHYNLSEEEETIVAQPHFNQALSDGSRAFGNKAAEILSATKSLLGNNAFSGENKRVVEYLGEIDDDSRAVKKTDTRKKYISFPSLNDLQDVLLRYGRDAGEGKTETVQTA
ncbi:primase-helicase family protein [Pseudohalocynthiibacter aestuariivivens]|uniref:Primase-helicase family protein n=1 Tax=Pseudohalocynthiibacter aestuariivivens TaxID=1591409 RepID=A0ABV5JJ82_9RHOB|nr:primase-helicase family protein [Pseudohalocynthiibacter aestuariivivens]MBS9716740.1 hypothetical protein [Pseudohalocynthiibacter aestuariivivens]